MRVAFKKDGGEWKAFPASCSDLECLKTVVAHYPKEQSWNISFSGRSLGPAETLRPERFEFYSDIGLERLKELAPSLGKRPGSRARRLIANSQPFYKDPDHWKPSQPAADAASALRAAFRKKFPDVEDCATGKPWKYSVADIRIVKAYASARGWVVAQLQLRGAKCDGPPDDAYLDQSFAISQGETSFLGSGLSLLDAGDYDNDGEAELVFAIDRYNEGGYELFYGNFRGHVIFQFGYH